MSKIASARMRGFASARRFALAIVVVSGGHAACTSVAHAQDADAKIAELQQRVGQLEEQIVDMQVVVGTLESLMKQGNVPQYVGAAAPVSGGGIDGAAESRIRALEIQVQALAAQLGGQPAPVGGYQQQQFDSSQALRGGTSADPSNGIFSQGGTPLVTDSGGGSFGQFTTQTDQDTGAGGALASASQPAVQGDGQGLGSGTGSAAYELAYGYLLQQDYGAAQAAFEDYLARFPNDELAGNAKYWLGESFYVRGQYRPAADAFLKGYREHRQGQKAPDSLLKLAMSLSRLDQRDAACASFVELDRAFPDAPAHVQRRAASERQRMGC